MFVLGVGRMCVNKYENSTQNLGLIEIRYRTRKHQQQWQRSSADGSQIGCNPYTCAKVNNRETMKRETLSAFVISSFFVIFFSPRYFFLLLWCSALSFRFDLKKRISVFCFKISWQWPCLVSFRFKKCRRNNRLLKTCSNHETMNS